jgi:restriction endonuclease S subunit
LEGLEITESFKSAALKNKDYRVDSQFYTQAPHKNPKLKYEQIGNLLTKAQYGISIEMNENNIGYPIYRMNEIHNMLCDIDVAKCADISVPEFKTFKLRDKDILFNRTNSFEWVGRTGLFRKNNEVDYIFASYLVRLNPNISYLLPEYLVTFLNTKYGIADIKRRARQSINQTNVNPEEVKEIEIPLLSMDFQKILELSFNIAHNNRVAFKRLYLEAETLLLKTLDLFEFKPSEEAVNIKSFSASFFDSGRLDAEFYQVKYDEIEEKLLSYQNGSDILNNVIEYIKTGEYSDTYYKKNNETVFYIRNSNIGNCIVTPDENYSVLSSDFNTSAVEGEILTSRVGTMGLFGVIPKELEGAVYSDNVLCFKLYSNLNLNPYVYALLFSTSYYKTLIEKISGGSVQPLITQTTIKKLIIPIIPDDVQNDVAEKLQKSFALKKQSEQLLELAKISVEKAIEFDEETATSYIKKELEKLGVDLNKSNNAE